MRGSQGATRDNRTHAGNKKPSAFQAEGGGKENWRRAYLAGLAVLAVVRLNFVVNFSTRPAVSTRRFSPV